MNYIDIILIILLIGSIISGGIKGFIAEIASVAAVILGVWGAIKLSGFTQTLIVERWNWNVSHVGIISFAITLLAIVVGVHILAKFLNKMTEATNLTMANRALGAFLSFFKAAFFLGVVLIFTDKIESRFTNFDFSAVHESKIAPPLQRISISAFPFLQGIYDDIKGNTTK